MNRKRRVKILTAMLFLMAVCMVCSVDAQAAKKKSKSKVTWKIKKGTLTVSGKGAMPSSLKSYKLTEKQRNKVKKVVIKKGVTAISNYAFKDMKKLKKVTIPSTVKKIGWEGFWGTSIKTLKVPASVRTIGQCAFCVGPKLKKLTLPGDFKIKLQKGDEEARLLTGRSSRDLNTITFNTKLNLSNVEFFYTKNFVLSPKDSKYRSIDGSIYTKDGKSLVRVPFMKSKLKIADTCTEFCLQSVKYYGIDWESDPSAHCTVSEIDIPPSVKIIESKKYRMRDLDVFPVAKINKITIRTKQLDGNSLAALVYDLIIDAEKIMEQLPEQVFYRDGKYMTRDGVWLKPNPRRKELLPS